MILYKGRNLPNMKKMHVIERSEAEMEAIERWTNLSFLHPTSSYNI